MMRAERVAQTFNGQAEWRVQGAYFKLLSTVNPVTVELWRQGQRVLYAGGAEGGFYQHIDFDQVKITTGALEAVAWIFGPAGGGSDRFTGDVDVIDDAARLLGVVTEGPYVAGVNYVSGTVILSAAGETVLAAAANLNGVVVHRSGIMTGVNGAANNSRIVLLAKTSAPSSVIDGEVLNSASSYMATSSVDSGQMAVQSVIDRPRLVAAGKGLYFYNGANNEVIGYRWVDYTVL